MRVTFRLVTSLVLAMAASAACGAPSGGTPRATLDRSEVDFGPVAGAQKLQATVRLTNTGDAPLLLGSVEASCACTVLMTDPTPIAPGQSRDLEVILTTDSLQAGPVSKTVLIPTNDPAMPKARLTVSAEVELDVEVSEPFVNFGDTPIDHTATRRLLVTSHRAGFRVTGVRSTDRSISVRRGLAAADGSTPITLSLEPVAEGPYFGVIVITTSSPGTPEIRLPVSGTIIPATPVR
jgi:hypothetical protein